MNPYLPFAALPLTVCAAWFAASNWSGSEPGRYFIPSVKTLEDPSALTAARSQMEEKPDIRVRAFLPHVPPKPVGPEPTLVLYSVMTGSKVRLATINGQVVKEGDQVAGYKVQRITADGVDLRVGEERRLLPMKPLHELPPPVQPGQVEPQKASNIRASETDLTEDFWKIFDSLNP